VVIPRNITEVIDARSFEDLDFAIQNAVSAIVSVYGASQPRAAYAKVAEVCSLGRGRRVELQDKHNAWCDGREAWRAEHYRA
jgi:accessory colonization factor AcfC